MFPLLLFYLNPFTYVSLRDVGPIPARRAIFLPLIFIPHIISRLKMKKMAHFLFTPAAI